MSEGVVREEARTVSRDGFITPTIGKLEQVLYFTTAPSATDKAKQVLDQGRLRIPGAVVVWDETFGRRKGAKAKSNAWWADTGSLTATFVFPKDAARDSGLLVQKAGWAVARVAHSFKPAAPLTFQAPNDLYLAERKAGALFLEPYGDLELLTVRLNCYVDLQRAPPTISSNAARLVDFIDVNQLPLQQESTLTNTVLTRLMSVLPEELSVSA